MSEEGEVLRKIFLHKSAMTYADALKVLSDYGDARERAGLERAKEIAGRLGRSCAD